MKKLSVLTVCVCVMTMWAVSLGASARGMSRVAGTVTDESGSPVSGVAVKATYETGGDVEATSDDKGEWAVGGLGKGEWSVMFIKPGFAPIRAKVSLPADMSRVPPIKIVLKKG